MKTYSTFRAPSLDTESTFIRPETSQKATWYWVGLLATLLQLPYMITGTALLRYTGGGNAFKKESTTGECCTSPFEKTMEELQEPSNSCIPSIMMRGHGLRTETVRSGRDISEIACRDSCFEKIPKSRKTCQLELSVVRSVMPL